MQSQLSTRDFLRSRDTRTRFLGTFWAFCNAVSQIFAVTRAALGSQIFCRLRVSLPSPDFGENAERV